MEYHMHRKHSPRDPLGGTLINILSIVVILVVVLAMPGGTGASVQAAPLFASGDLDTTFSGDGKVLTTFVTGQSALVRDIAVQANGKIVAAGETWPSDVDHNFAVARYNPGGALDTTFSGDGLKIVSLGGDYDMALGLAIHPPTRKIVLAGDKCPGTLYPCDSGVLRFNPAGGLDTTFNATGKRIDNFGGDNGSHAVAIYPDGRIVAAGYMENLATGNSDFEVIVYTAAGNLDTTFSGDGRVAVNFGSGRQEVVSAVALQPDGKIVLGGQTCESGWTNCHFALARLNTNGSLDTTFSGDGRQITSFGAFEYIKGLALQADGKIVAVGGKHDGSTAYFALARYNTNGSLDATFGSSGKRVTDFTGDVNNDNANDVVIQSDGKIVVCGLASNGVSTDFALARYTSSGNLDPTFSGDGKTMVDFGRSDVCNALALQPDGKYVLGGHSVASEFFRWVVARVLP
jgi:uncharacterized delta-60 repeat protein